MKRLALLLLFTVMLSGMALAYGVTFYNPGMNPQDGTLLEKVNEDEPSTIKLDNEDVAVKQITFTVDRDAQTAGVTVYNLLTAPLTLPDIDNAYEYNEYRYGGFATHELKRLIIEFEVKKDWLTENEVNRNSIVYQWYDSGFDVWEEMPTAIESETDTSVRYTATLDQGARLFVIAQSQGETVAEPVQEPVSGPAPTEPEPEPTTPAPSISEEVEPALPGQPELELEKPITTIPTPVQEPEPAPVAGDITPSSGDKSSLRYLFYILLIVVVIIIVYYLVSGSTPRGVDREIHRYIKESKKHGKSKDEIKHRLLQVGWHPERVEKALDKHKFIPGHGVKGESVKQEPKKEADSKTEEKRESKENGVEETESSPKSKKVKKKPKKKK